MDEPAKMVVWYHAASNTAVRHLEWETVPPGYVISDDPVHARMADEFNRQCMARLDAELAADPALAN